jgi:hypothetical protein
MFDEQAGAEKKIAAKMAATRTTRRLEGWPLSSLNARAPKAEGFVEVRFHGERLKRCRVEALQAREREGEERQGADRDEVVGRRDEHEQTAQPPGEG